MAKKRRFEPSLCQRLRKSQDENLSEIAARCGDRQDMRDYVARLAEFFDPTSIVLILRIGDKSKVLK